MSVLDSVKETLGLVDTAPEYKCESCGTEFHSGTEPETYWFECPECGADEAERLD